MPYRVRTCCFHSNLLMFCNSHSCSTVTPLLSVYLYSLTWINSTTSVANPRQQREFSLSWRCERLVSVSLCLCIIVKGQRVICNLRGVSFTTCCRSSSQKAAFSMDMFVFSASNAVQFLYNFMKWAQMLREHSGHYFPPDHSSWDFLMLWLLLQILEYIILQLLQ